VALRPTIIFTLNLRPCMSMSLFFGVGGGLVVWCGGGGGGGWVASNVSKVMKLI